MKKKQVCLRQGYVIKQNENGFTLVEMLLALSTFIMIIFFISPSFQIILNNRNLNEKLQGMEWDVFCSQMKKELRMSTNAKVTGNSVILTEDSGTVIFEKYGTSIRRRVNFTGHEILLQNVSTVQFIPLKNGIQATVKDLSGKEYSVICFSFLNWDEST